MLKLPSPTYYPRFLARALTLALTLLPWGTSLPAVEENAPHVLLVTTDGLRWQEVFRGADDALMNRAGGGVADAAVLTEKFGGESPEERRRKLLPFLWGKIAREGQIYGHRDCGSLANVTNGRRFSYPGYNELLTGHADDVRITSNRPIPNPNVTVLEWLLGRPGFTGQVFACNAWHAFPAILNTERSKVPTWTGGLKNAPEIMTPRLEELESLAADIPSPWPDEHYDALVGRAALEIIAARHPRVLYVNFGETDEWAHARRYDHYLEAAHRVDAWLKTAWETLQSSPEYRGRTALLFTTDHGRGMTGKNWTDHGEKVEESGQIWLAAMGPGVPALGERKDAPPIQQAQVAATVAQFAGEDYGSTFPEAAPPIAELFTKESP